MEFEVLEFEVVEFEVVGFEVVEHKKTPRLLEKRALEFLKPLFCFYRTDRIPSTLKIL